MNLPQSHRAEITREKITEYLLNPSHPDAAGKAAFFAVMGFTVGEWRSLADALRDVAASCPVVKMAGSAHGTKYVVDGTMITPTGRTPRVRTVWIIDKGKDTPRLVTAYPLEEGD